VTKEKLEGVMGSRLPRKRSDAGLMGMSSSQVLTESNPYTSLYPRHSDADTSDSSTQLLDKGQRILQAVCYRTNVSYLVATLNIRLAEVLRANSDAPVELLTSL
jgi:hypothetical protein